MSYLQGRKCSCGLWKWNDLERVCPREIFIVGIILLVEQILLPCNSAIFWWKTLPSFISRAANLKNFCYEPEKSSLLDDVIFKTVMFYLNGSALPLILITNSIGICVIVSNQVVRVSYYCSNLFVVTHVFTPFLFLVLLLSFIYCCLNAR